MFRHRRRKSRWGLAGLTILAFTISPIALAAPPAELKIWDREIMPQPFDTAPFRQIKIPAWVEQTTGCGYTLSVMDSAARTRAAQHGVTISEMGFVDPFYAYYDSKLLQRRSPHVPLDRLEKDIAEYKRLGVRILGVYPPCLQGEVYESHPEWRRIATDTTAIPQIDLKLFPHGGMLCLLGPYGNFFIDVLAEIAVRFPDVDAFSFDGLHYGGVCYCQSCRENYRRDAKAENPAGGPERSRIPPLPALGRPADGRSRAAHADATQGIEARLGARDLDHQRGPLWPLPQHTAEHAGADELAARRPRPGILAR